MVNNACVCSNNQSVSQILTHVILLTCAGNTSELLNISSHLSKDCPSGPYPLWFSSAMLAQRMITQNYVKGYAQNFGFRNLILDGFVPKYLWKFHYCVNFQVEDSPLQIKIACRRRWCTHHKFQQYFVFW